MIYNVSVKEERDKVIEYLKENEGFRVVDLGGSMFPWAKEVVTHYFDILSIHEYLGNETCVSPLYTEKVKNSVALIGDINDGYGWKETFKDVEKNGLFDFAICTQTLEDIRNPSYVLRTLPQIAKQGFISIPHKYRELNYVEGYDPVAQEAWGLNKPYIGYCHHRWIFSIIDGPKLRLFPKLEFVACVIGIQELIKGKPVENELSFWWKDDIPFEIINSDFLGPNPPSVMRLYEKLLPEGI